MTQSFDAELNGIKWHFIPCYDCKGTGFAKGEQPAHSVDAVNVRYAEDSERTDLNSKTLSRPALPPQQSSPF